MGDYYRILSLSGGGARGIFQASVLKYMEESLKKDEVELSECFEMYCGTSTGAIIALALGYGETAESINDMYEKKLSDVFPRRFPEHLVSPKHKIISRLLKALSQLNKLKSPVYKMERLKAVLDSFYGNRILRDLSKDVIVTASRINQFSHHTFASGSMCENLNQDIFIADAAASSAAAPIYFEPVCPKGAGQQLLYADGGLWANSPSLIGVISAHKYRNKAFDKIKVMSIGTGDFNDGAQKSDFIRKPSHSVGILAINMMFATQDAADEYYTKKLIGENNYIKINYSHKELIEIDDVVMSSEILPQKAQVQIQDCYQKIKSFIGV